MTAFQHFPLYRVTVRDASGPLCLITFLSPTELKAIGGLPPQVIVGKLSAPSADLVPAHFARNRAFVDFLHDVIRKRILDSAELVAAARQKGSGWMHIHDARAWDDDPAAAAADIIGSFKVVAGRIVPESYAPNPNHQILSKYGMFTPSPEIQDWLLSAMRKLRL